MPFLLYISLSELSWLAAYLTGNYQPINPLPKFLPIPDAQYPLYQAIVGPLVKASAVFIFLAVFSLAARLLKRDILSLRLLAVCYLLVGNTWALVAWGVDQVIVWGQFQGAVRFLLSWVHPLVFVLAVISIYHFVRSQGDYPRGQTLVLVLPAMLLSGPIPGMFFR